MRRLVQIIFYSLIFQNCYAQQDVTPWAGFGIEANLFAGKVIKHDPAFTLPLPEITTGIDLNFQLKTYGKKEWEQRRRYPVIGVGIAYTDYGIDSIYGRCVSIYPNITIPLITGKKLEWTLRIGDGLGYVTRDYSRVNPVDTINVAIGSRINDYFSFLTDLRYHLNNNWDIQLGANFSHISDASFHQPNLGVNVPGVHVGIKYFPVTSKPKHIVRDLKPLNNRWLIEYRLGIAFDQSNAPLGPTYPAYLASLYASKRWLSKNKVFGGVDYSFHESIDAYLHNNVGFVPQGTEAEHSYKSAVFAGNEFLLGRIGIMLQLGWYVHEAFQSPDKYYEKLGGNFYIVQKEHGPIKEVFLSALLKAHLFVAELGEFGIGMGF